MEQLDQEFYDEILELYKERRSSKFDDPATRALSEANANDALYVFCLAFNKLIKSNYFTDKSIDDKD